MRRFPLALLLSVFAAIPAYADTTQQDKGANGILSLVVENDLIVNNDSDYTNGVRLSWLSPEGDAPRWVDWAADTLFPFAVDGQRRGSIAFGQSLFTPYDIRLFPVDTADRPYAGWLYGTIGIIADNDKVLDQYLLTLGMVGPDALGEQTQKFVHKLIDSPKPRGWDSWQIQNEPGIVFSWERKWRNILAFSPFGLGIDVSPQIGADIGNIYTNASTGLMLRLGQDLPADYGPPRIRPSLPGSDFFLQTDTLGWYVFAGVEGRAVARNIFLDGNTFRNSPSVDKEWLVGNAQAGFAITYDRVRLSYTHVFQTREFEGQRRLPQFGGISISYRY